MLVTFSKKLVVLNAGLLISLGVAENYNDPVVQARLGNPNYPNVIVHPVPKKMPEARFLPNEKVFEGCSVASDDYTNPVVELKLNDSDQLTSFNFYTAKSCFTSENDLSFIYDLFGIEDKEEVKDFRSLVNEKVEINVVCVKNKQQQFCELKVAEKERNAVYYDHRDKFLVAEFDLKIEGDFFKHTDFSSMELTADALVIQVEDPELAPRLKFRFQM